MEARERRRPHPHSPPTHTHPPTRPPIHPVVGAIASCTLLFTFGFRESTARYDVDVGIADLEGELEALRHEADDDSDGADALAAADVDSEAATLHSAGGRGDDESRGRLLNKR